MRLSYVLVAALLIGVPGFAVASRGGEEAIALDLSAIPNGPILFLKCSNGGPDGRDLSRCGMVSLWQQSNPIPGLQTSIFTSGRAWDPDTRILP